VSKDLAFPCFVFNFRTAMKKSELILKPIDIQFTLPATLKLKRPNN
jgi:hypothetical protein